MIPVFQEKTVAKDGYGDCFNACIASLLELPLAEVHSIFPNTRGNWHEQWRVWLAEKGFKQDHWFGEDGTPPGYAIAHVETHRVYPDNHKKAGQPIKHACIVLDGVIVHDPHPEKAEFYKIDYYSTLEPLSDAEKQLHKLNMRYGSCLHGYSLHCDICIK